MAATAPQCPASLVSFAAGLVDKTCPSCPTATVCRSPSAYNRELIDLVSIPSVSSLPENLGDLLRAASWLEQRMQTAGLQVW